MKDGWCKLILENIDADKVEDIATTFFQQSYLPFIIKSKSLQNGTWFVEALITQFGIESDRILTIDSKTGRLISCNKP